jgi:putative FmdB family regulatory protein
MPIYEYQCKECGHQLEAIQRFSDAPLSECPACHKLALAKQISAPSFRLKGAGWYETDFKTTNKRHGTQDAESGSACTKSESANTETSKTETSKTETSKTETSKTASSSATV